ARRDESGNELGPRRWCWRRWTFASARVTALDRRFEFHDRHRRNPRPPGGFENDVRMPLQGASLIREACLAAIEYTIQEFAPTGATTVDLELTEEQKLLQKSVREFAE